MNIAVIGAGAMGGALAGQAARAGHDVCIVDVAADLVARINDAGIVVDTPEGQLTERVRATDDPEQVGPVDAVVVFVKGYHTRAAGQTVSRLVGPDTVVATLQNGWGNADTLAELLPAERLVVGVTYNSCTAVAPGHARHSGRGQTVVGPYAPGGDLAPAQRIAELLASSGWEAEATAAVRTEIWKKLVLNAATLPTAALSGLTAGEVGRPGPLLDLVDDLTAEAVAVARAQSLDIDLHERVERIHQTLERAGSGKASMLQDVEARRRTEIDTVNGAVVRAAEAAGVDVPRNRAMVALVDALERSWSL